MAQQCPRHGVGRPHPGFTLIEVIIVLVLVGILAGMSYSGWKRVMWRVQVLGAADEFRNALMLARTDAISRQRYSGVLLDPAGLRYLRFVDSSSTGVHDGRYSAGDPIIANWSALPAHLLVLSVTSSISAPVTIRNCGASATTGTASSQSGTFALVFGPDGRSMATFQAKLGVESSLRDTFLIQVLPPTGLVTLEH